MDENVCNTAPQITSVSITPSNPTVNDTLTCQAVVVDPDGDTVATTYEWEINAVVYGTGMTLDLPSIGVQVYDIVTCQVYASDGNLTTQYAESVTVSN